MTFSLGAWSLATAATSLVLLGALIVTALAANAIVRLRKDARLAEAAERHVHVDLQYLAKRYIPLALMTGNPTTELPMIIHIIATRRRLCLRTIIASTALSAILAVSVALGVRHEVIAAWNEAARRAAGPPIRAISVNPLRDIQGTWGAPFDFLLSCAQNPRSIRLADDGHRLIVAFEKPPAVPGGEKIQTVEFTIVGVQQNVIMLGSGSGPPLTDALGQPVLVKLTLDDPNTYHMSRSDRPLAVAATIARCPIEKMSGSQRSAVP